MPKKFFQLLVLITASAACWHNSAWGYLFNQQQVIISKKNIQEANWQRLSFKKYSHYNGVGLLKNFYNGPVCSATLLDTGGNDQAPAYAVTAGHCIIKNFADAKLNASPQTVHLNRPLKMSLVFNHFFDQKNAKEITLEVLTARYVLVQRYDLAVLELNLTVGAIKRLKIHPLVLAKTTAANASPISVLQHPILGPGRDFLHQSQCTILDQMQFQETFQNKKFERLLAIANRCSELPGSSGSPLVLGDTNQIIGVVSAANRYDQLLAFFDDPKISQIEDINFGSSTLPLVGCFANGIFNLSLKSCGLEQPRTNNLNSMIELQQHCQNGDANACYHLGDSKNLVRSCLLNNAKGCSKLGDQLYQLNQPTKKAAALALYQKACDLGYNNDCFWLADNEIKSNSPVTALALSYWQQACNRRHGSSCTHLALHQVDTLSAEKYFKTLAKGCLFGSARGCYQLGLAYSQTNNGYLKPSHLQAQRFITMACQDGLSEACQALPLLKKF